MKRMIFILLAILLLTRPQWASIAPATAADASQEPGCLFFTETASGEGGFSVCDDQEANFRTPFESWGLQKIGYPISQRYVHDGFVTQAFQKAIMQWRPDGNIVALVNIFDDLHNAGFDDTLLSVRQTPRQLPAGWDGDIPFDEVIKKRQALLDVRPALRETYFASSDPLTFYGLPTSEVEDMGNHYAVRLQRAVLQEWKEEVPWASAGEVTIANGGDIAKELGGLPAEALIPESGPLSSTTTLLQHPGILGAAWANDHTLVVRAGDDIWLYDINTLERAPQLLSGSICSNHGSRCLAGLTISHNGEWLALSLGPPIGHADSLLLWSLTSLGEPKALTGYPILSWGIAISPNGRSAAFVDANQFKDIYLWDVASDNVKRLPNDLGAVIGETLTFRSDGAVVMAGIRASYPEGAIRRWNVEDQMEMDALSVQVPIAFSPDGQTAATRGTDLVKLWDLSREPVTSREFGAPLSAHSNLSGFTFSQNGSKLAVETNSSNVEIWDVSTESLLGTMPSAGLTAWSPSGRFAAFATDSCWLWDVTQNKRLAILAPNSCPPITFSPNERWLTSTKEGLLQLSNIESLLEK